MSDKKENPTRELLKIKQSQIQSSIHERDMQELRMKRQMSVVLEDSLAGVRALFGDPISNLDTILGFALLDDLREHVEMKSKEIISEFRALSMEKGGILSKEELAKMSEGKLKHFKDIVDKINQAVKYDYGDLTNLIFPDVKPFMKQHFKRYMPIREQYIAFIESGNDPDKFFEEKMVENIEEMLEPPIDFAEYVEEEKMNEIPAIKPIPKESSSVNKKKKATFMELAYSQNNLKKTKKNEMGTIDRSTQQNLDNFVEMKLRDTQLITAGGESFLQADPIGANEIFQNKDIHNPIDMIDRELTPLENFIETTLKKESNVWLFRDYGDADEERKRKIFPENNGVDKIFDGIMHMTGDEVRISLTRFLKIAQEIVKNYDLKDEDLMGLESLISQACGFLYACLSVHGPNLLRLGELIFNKRSGLDTPNIPAFLTNLSAMGNIHANVQLLKKLRKHISERLSTFLKVGEHTHNGRTYGLFGLTYLYSTEYEEEGRNSNWCVINNFARAKVLSGNQWKFNKSDFFSETLKVLRFESPELRSQITSLLSSRLSSESMIISYMALVTIFCDVENTSQKVGKPKYLIDELIQYGYRISKKAVNGEVVANQNALIISDILLEICARVLPLAVMNNYKYYVLEARKLDGEISTENPLIKYIKYCGLNLDPNIPASGTFTRQQEIIKTTNDTAMISEGHYHMNYENTFVRSFTFNQGLIENINIALNTLKIMNNISLFTPLIPKNIGNIFSLRNEIRDKKLLNISLATLVEYMSAFANVLYRNPMSGRKIFSIVLQYEVGATMNGEFMTDSLVLGGVEVLNVFRDKLFKDGVFTEQNSEREVFDSIKLKVHQYTEFVRGIGDFFNKLSGDDYAPLETAGRVKEWVNEHLSKYVNVIVSDAEVEFTDLILKKLSAGANSLGPNKHDIDINELVESSDGSFYIFTWVAANARAYLERMKSSGVPINERDIRLEISFVGRAKFTINMVSDPNNRISELIEMLKTQNREIPTKKFTDLLQFLEGDDSDTITNEYSKLLDIDRKAVESLPLFEIHRLMKIREESEVSTGSSLLNADTTLYINKLKEYSLFSQNSNDSLNCMNKGYVHHGFLNIPVEYFDTRGVPCIYFAMWYHLMLNKLATSVDDTAIQILWNDYTLESIYFWVRERILDRIVKQNKVEETIIASRVDVYHKLISSGETAFAPKNSKDNSIANINVLIEDGMSIERLILMDNMMNNDLFVESGELNYWGYPLTEKGGIQPAVKIMKIINNNNIQEAFVPKHKSLILTPEKLLKNMFTASNYLAKAHLHEEKSEYNLLNIFSEDIILFKDVVNSLSGCVGDSISDFLITLRKYNIEYDKFALEKNMITYEGIVYLHECNSWLITNTLNGGNWVKTSTLELIQMVPILVRDKSKANPETKIMERRFIVYLIEKNHLTVLTPKESELFIKRKVKDSTKAQIECYTLSGRIIQRDTSKDFRLEFLKNVKKFKELRNLKQGYSTNARGFMKDVANIPSILCAWDIESYTGENNLQFPYVISLIIFTDKYFYLASEIDSLNLEDDVNKSIITVKSFIGDNCVDEFVEYIMFLFFNNTCVEFVDRMVEEIYLFTFNGTKFDHPIVIKKLLSCGCDIIGQGVNNPKSIIVSRTRGSFNFGATKNCDKMKLRKLVFNDFLALHPTGSLDSVCKSLFPTVPALHKSKFDIGGLRKEEFINKIKQITKYCERDCLALTSCILVNKVNTTKLIYKIIENSPIFFPNGSTDNIKEQNMCHWNTIIPPWQFRIYHLISATAWTFEIFKSYFLPFYTNNNGNVVRLEMLGEKNDEIYKIVKSTYRGGMTVVFTEEFEQHYEFDLEIYDINSSYPNSMSEGVPFNRFGDTFMEEDINEDEDIYELDSFALYWVEILDMSLFDEEYYFKRKIKGKKAFKGINPQRIYPFAVKSSKNKIKELGLIYPAVITNQWLWGREINIYVDTICELTGMYPEKFGDIFHRIKISKILRQCNDDEWSSGVECDPNLILKPFVSFFYDMKRRCKVEKDLKPLENLFKLFLNGLYGKFGQKDYPETSYCFGAPDLKELSRKPDKLTIKACGPLAEVKNTIYKVETEKPYRSTGSLVRIASYISMASRMKLWSTMVKITSNKKGVIPEIRPIVYYCDTDSIFVAGGFPQELVHDSNLGAWKAENPKEYVKKFNPGITEEDLNNFQIENAFFLAPKCYGVFNKPLLAEFKKNVEMLVGSSNFDKHSLNMDGWIKTKGVSKGKISIHGFIELIINKTLSISQLQFRRSLGQVFVDPDFHKTISLKYKKRIFGKSVTPSKAFYSIEDFEAYVLPLLK